MPAERRSKLMKMSELVKRTGLDRQAIHFYIKKGLLPRPLKTKRNMAYYDESYVDRIKLIKNLQLKRFLENVKKRKKRKKVKKSRKRKRDLLLLSIL